MVNYANNSSAITNLGKLHETNDGVVNKFEADFKINFMEEFLAFLILKQDTGDNCLLQQIMVAGDFKLGMYTQAKLNELALDHYIELLLVAMHFTS